MKKIFKTILALSLPILSFLSAEAESEPETSVMASGHWVKIRVDADGIYQMTYEQLRELGFSDPSKVKVFGYDPSYLLTHQPDLMPADLSPLYTCHIASEQKLVFYGKSDTAFAPELWNKSGSAINSHSKHSYFTGASYFLSDADAEIPEIGVIDAPDADSVESDQLLTTHTSVFFYEEDLANLGVGGYCLSGEPINSLRPTETHSFSVSKVADDGVARMVSKSFLSASTNSTSNYLQATFPEEIVAEGSTGRYASWLSDDHDVFSPALRFETLTLPVDAEQRTYDVEFAVHPSAASMESDCALDFYAVLYNRNNDLTDEAQMYMYFENWLQTADFALSGFDSDWQVWNVNDPLAVSRYELTDCDGSAVGRLASVTTNYPNEVIAFNVKKEQMQPVVIGVVENQNLHSATTPELVILTTSTMLEAAEYAADFHRRTQNINVLVVDQQDVFNEYGSGNTSPEAIRRFLRHLDSKQSETLRALLIIGPATQMNASLVSDDNPYVVIAECEDEEYCGNETRSYCSDAFYGRLGDLYSVDNWKDRRPQWRVLGATMDIGVGRLPFTSISEVKNYYAKAEDYIVNTHLYPSIGNVVMCSDFSAANSDAHYLNSEAMISAIGSGVDTDITVYRPASNFYSTLTGTTAKDNVQVKKLQKRGLERGAGLYAFFGHGSPHCIGGTNKTVDFHLQISDIPTMNNYGRYPLVYLATCRLAPIDIYSSYLSKSLVADSQVGAIAVVASAREVYQPMNQDLGERIASEMYSASAGDWLGDVWRRAHTSAVQYKGRSKQHIANHLNYNFIGDPALPVFAPTNKVAVSSVNSDNTLIAKGENTVTGVVTDFDGETDADFNGKVILTVYDVPETFDNIVTVSSSTELESITDDTNEIGEYIGEVKNGEFSIKFIGPVSSSEGTHRIRLYAYSTDGNKRGLGSATELSLVADAELEVGPEGDEPVIEYFIAGTGDVDVHYSGRVELSARISLPAGIAQASALVSPVTLVIDDDAQSGASRLLTLVDKNTYEFGYVTPALTGGRHSATLSVLDAAGRWVDATTVFMVDNTLSATLSAAVGDAGVVNFEFVSAMDSSAENVLVVERLDGSVVEKVENISSSHELTLDSGIYRAYVQLHTATTFSSTPKIEIIVN